MPQYALDPYYHTSAFWSGQRQKALHGQTLDPTEISSMISAELESRRRGEYEQRQLAFQEQSATASQSLAEREFAARQDQAKKAAAAAKVGGYIQAASAIPNAYLTYAGGKYALTQAGLLGKTGAATGEAIAGGTGGASATSAALTGEGAGAEAGAGAGLGATTSGGLAAGGIILADVTGNYLRRQDLGMQLFGKDTTSKDPTGLLQMASDVTTAVTAPILVPFQAVGNMLGIDDPSCFISTACVKAMRMEDNCPVLETLRNFRDSYVPKALVTEYYRIAPKIVEAIGDDELILRRLYKGMIEPCVMMIHDGNFEGALTLYRNTVMDLKSRYNVEVE